jgi:hypothetical protein
MTLKKSLWQTCSMLVLAGSVACAGGETAGEPATRATPAQPATAASGSSAADFSASDLDAYGKGMTREIAAVRAAQKEPDKWDTATIPLGAEAAGLPEDRYRRVRDAVNEVFKTLDFQGKIDGPMQIDLARVDEATRTRIARDPFTDLTPGAAAALRAAMDRLVPIWIEYVRLTAVAG